MNTGRVLRQASTRLFGGAGSFRNASSSPTSRKRCAPMRGIGAHRARNALRRAEQVPEDRNRRAVGSSKITFRMLEEQCGAVRAQSAIAKCRHLEARVDRRRHALQFAARFELRDEVAQVAIAHARSRGRQIDRARAAIHRDDCARHVTGPRRGEEQRDLRDFLRRAEPAQAECAPAAAPAAPRRRVRSSSPRQRALPARARSAFRRD